jgi:uncharacterized protein (TIGR00288 family)
MKVQHKEQRVCVLIDAQNLYHSAKNLYNSRVSFGNVLSVLVDKRRLVRAFAYVIKTKTGEEKAFFEALIELGIETRVKDLKEFHGGMKKGDWDVGMAVDAIKISDCVDVIILVSGDGDFVPLVEYLKNHGKKVEVAAFGRSAAAELKEEADEFIDLEKNTGKFLLKK